ncbi:FAD-dependent oxidoreductase [Pseudonocardia lacus]|uniref:FAD-dependent oxidoreductase n=1 Tax=Pseudonocardia lacus TaxID=2835865 RepID=UPI001BDD09FE|nr:FAD-dependent oxidoreductase [Pseudonocardia lacus]
MDRIHDVVVVGGGIAGSALATVLARDGYDVLVLERQTSYRDKVRGETLLCWGVVELQRLGLEQVLLDAGGCYATRMVPYDELLPPAHAEAAAAPLAGLLPGVPGALDVGHPEACEALATAAAGAGATVVRGVGDVEVVPGEEPVVRYEHDDVAYQVGCRLVVGADGRMSTVRRQLGIELQQCAPRTMGGGMLVDGLHDWPAGQMSLGTEGDVYYLMFPRAGGRARLYLMHDLAQRGRFAGPDREKAFLDAYQLSCIPGSAMFAAAEPAGPCVFYPMNDSWVDDPRAPGVVLIGDAAGWNDPIIGQGLSISLRDVRMVADVLRASTDRSPAAFTPYVEERRERMRRLRISAEVVTALSATFTPQATARRAAYSAVFRTDPVLGGPRLATIVGPDQLPAEGFTRQNVERILAMG